MTSSSTSTSSVPTGAPLATALVIGIGGTGIQTIARLQPAVRDHSRPDAVAHERVAFLGIDAVDTTMQHPALPEGSDLTEREFFNVVPRPVNADQLVKSRQVFDGWLRTWWDPTYHAPNEPLINGLRRSRMLGRLAFREVENDLRSRVTDALQDAVRLDPESLSKVQLQTGGVLQVFIVASVVGGTGSSGFLEVLRAVHAAARQANVHAEVWPVLFLPGVFAEVRSTSANPAALERAHLANAYAFFRELDHVVTVEGAFDELLAPPSEQPLGLSAAQVVSGVFLIDSVLSNGMRIDQKDCYGLAASALYDLIVSGTRDVLGVRGVNVRDTLSTLDDLGRRRCYGSLGVARVVFPGSTYRRYLRARTAHELLGRFLLAENTNWVQQERDAGLIGTMMERLEALLDRIDTAAEDLDDARDLQRSAARLASSVDEAAPEEQLGLASEMVNRLQSRAHTVAQQLENRLTAEVRLVRDEFDEVLDLGLAESGQSLRVLEYTLEKLDSAERLQQLESQAESALSSAVQGRRLATDGVAEDSLLGAVQGLERVRSAGLLSKALNRDAESKAVARLGDAATTFARYVRTEQVQQARLRSIRHARERVRVALESLRSAQAYLRAEWDRLGEVWVNDELEGKDIGPRSLTAYIPDDIHPDVEFSSFAETVWAEVTDDLGKDPSWAHGDNGVPALRELYLAWLRPEGLTPTRGLVGLGLTDEPSVADASRSTFTRLLSARVDALARVADRFPEDLFDAADVVDARTGSRHQRESLETALANLSRLGDAVALAYDAGRIRNQGGSTAPPPPERVISTTRGLMDRLPSLPTGATPVETRDPEAVDTTAILTGIPVHAVAGMPTWRRYYDDVLRTRRTKGAQASDAPPHIDRRFSSTLQDVMPRMFRDDEMARTFTRAALLLVLSSTIPDQFESLGLGGRFPIVVERRRVGLEQVEEFVGTPLVVDDMVTWSAPVRLGTTYRETFDSMPKHALLIEGIDHTFVRVEDRLDDEQWRSALQTAAERYAVSVGSRTAEVQQNRRRAVDDLPLLELVLAELDYIRRQLATWRDGDSGSEATWL